MTTLYSPQMIEVWYILPAIRREFVKNMVKRGLKQKDAAKVLGLTEAAVSQYLLNKRATKINFNSVIKEEIHKSAGRILAKGHVIAETQRICELIRKSLVLCQVSKRLGYAPKNCKECFK